MAVRKPWALKNPVIQNVFGRPLKHQSLNCELRSINSVNQKPSVLESQEIFCHTAGIFASYMLSSASRRFSDMMMVPSMASLRSFKVVRTVEMTLCMRSISCCRKMFIGARLPIFASFAFTSNGM
ncbi:hypothetical protein NP493_215g00027 [Ridgeia piscesae]|uniref:Uncharacterized protein n=1 Tax=Ridgeia piscesae TaxID=27915 RepID=A0AAD9P0M0_RIDPI|nr:hypothetical protein NP493_215g00027 [Ridgeia piscesae]